jgi:hypothetical protein
VAGFKFKNSNHQEGRANTNMLSKRSADDNFLTTTMSTCNCSVLCITLDSNQPADKAELVGMPSEVLDVYIEMNVES